MENVFIGWTDVCGQIGDYQKAYRKLGHKTFSMALSKEAASENTKFSWLVYPDWIFLTNNKFLLLFRKLYTILILPVMRLFFWTFALFYFDIFHFMWVPEKSNVFLFWLIKFFKKKIIVTFVGSEIRWVPSWLQEFDMRGLDHPEENLRMQDTVRMKSTLDERLRYVRIFEKYADVIISVPEQAQLQLRPYTNFYLPVDLESIHFSERNNTIPIVCIGTTGFRDKGSQKLIDNLNEFHKNSPVKFELIVLKNMLHSEVLNLLMKCDIFIYSPYDCGTGKFGMESLAAGAVTLTGYDKDWLKYPLNSPVVHVQEKTLIEKLSYYLEHPEERKELSKRSREFALENANIYKITEDILKVLHGQKEAKDYYPKFFRDLATFKSKWDALDSVEVCNKWNDYVRNCGWYKEYVPSGERDGIKF